MHDLGLEDRLLMTSKNSVAAQNRFVYYPDHLVRMPGPGVSLLQNFSALLSEPIFNGLISSALTEVAKSPRPNELQDESVGSFISRRFGSNLADNIVSAVFHGVYAGDIYNLSARTILAGVWQLELQYQSIVKGVISAAMGATAPVALEDLAIIKKHKSRPPRSDAIEAAKQSSVFTFRGGIGELADRLESKLAESPRVSIKRRTIAEHIELISDVNTPKVRFYLSATSGSSY